MKYIVFFICIVMFSNCEPNNKATKKVDFISEKESINLILNDWHKSAAEANFEAYFNAMSNESIFIGTDASENWKLTEFKNFSKPYFDKGKAWSFKPLNRNIYINSATKIAWFDELLDTWMGVCRGSGVLIKSENTWKIEHYVLSLTIPNENVNDVVNINKEKDSLFKKKFK